MKTALILAAFLALASAFAPSALDSIRKLTPAQRANNAWSVIVAGSNDYSNYRHQSDICQMFHSLRKLGVPEAHIIVMMYDDIANSYQNPRPGVIINTPGGENVYEGVPKDYTGKLVTAGNFIKVITGGSIAGSSGKTLQSTKEDHVFIFFSDHGGYGLLGFPYDTLSDSELETGLNTMYKKNLYGTLVFHVEACEAGSMFFQANLPPNAYIHTASPVSESSYAWQWDDTVGAYVSDVWSWYAVHFMEDHPEKDMQDLFDYVYDSMNNYSIPCQYGDLAVTSNKIGEFFSESQKSNMHTTRRPMPKDAVKAYNVTLNAALRRHAAHPTAETAAIVEKELAIHAAVDALNEKFIASAGVNGKLKNDPSCNAARGVARCMKQLSTVFRSKCTINHEYLGLIYETMWGVCSSVPSNGVSRAARVLSSGCSNMVSSL